MYIYMWYIINKYKYIYIYIYIDVEVILICDFDDRSYPLHPFQFFKLSEIKERECKCH